MNDSLVWIDQSGIESIYKGMLENPVLYRERPILIWNSNFKDGILFPKLMEVNRAYNKNKNNENREYFRIKCLNQESLKDMDTQDMVNANKHKACVLYVGILDAGSSNPYPFVSGSGMLKDCLEKIKESLKVPVILHLPFSADPEAVAGMNVRQYEFHPCYEEWKQSLVEHKNSLDNLLLRYLDSYLNMQEKDYRWYWYFHRCTDREPKFYFDVLHKGTGCDFPSCWTEGLHKLRRFLKPPMAQIPKNYSPRKAVRISEIPAERFKSFFEKGISEDVIQEFRDYLIEHADNMPDV